MVKPEVTTGCRVPKGWGQEIIIENNEKYCQIMKIISMKNIKRKTHSHMLKAIT